MWRSTPSRSTHRRTQDIADAIARQLRVSNENSPASLVAGRRGARLLRKLVKVRALMVTVAVVVP